MPYERNVDTLRPFIGLVLEQQEIKDKAVEAAIDLEDLAAELAEEKKADTIWQAAWSEVGAYNGAWEKHQKLLAEAEQKVPPIEVWRELLGYVPYLAMVPLAALGVGFFVSGYTHGFADATASLFGNSVALAQVAFLFLIAFLGARVVTSPWQLRAERERKFKEAKESLGVDALRKEVLKLHGEADARIKEVIAEEFSECYDQQVEPSYDPVLEVTKTPGLAEVPDKNYAVTTDARERLDSMLNSMPGGSIGIAGPRGSGKTTLLLTYCGGAVEKIGERQVLGVMTSSPVEYEPRDFILYLFQSVCYAVLRKFKEDLNDPPWASETSGARDLSRRARANVWVLAVSLLFSGVALIVLAFALAPLKPAAANSNAANSNAAAPSTPPAAAAQPAASPTASPTPEKSAAARYVEAFGIQPGTLLMWGIFLTLPGAVLYYLHRRTRPSPTPEPQGGPPRPDYVSKAWEWVRAIKFQQSYTSGWSGALKLPVGFEGSMSRAVSLAEKQMSLPEIVGGLREFLVELTRDFTVVIGIDELDKLESDEKAQQFVNEIKSIFGLRHCFYLVSVSESAMSNFERRGIPFRDAFDSSFDNILYVDYLSFGAAKKLIARRVIGMSRPFRCLCYCASGGLARDLIRACRSLIDLSRGKEGVPAVKEFDALCLLLARDDVKAKIRAVRTSAQKLELDPEAGDFLAGLNDLEGVVESGGPPDEEDALLRACSGLRVSLARELSADREEAKVLAERRLKLASLGDELTAYVYYWQTLLDFLKKAMKEGTLPDAEKNNRLHELARARQSLSIKPTIARTTIDRFRTRNGMTPFDFSDKAAAVVKPAAGGNGSAAALLVMADPQAVRKSLEGLKGFLEKMSAGENGG